eukprot:TRINITY_DN12940_c0_g1_i2.p1 TRINITY_DN12940_c0_g1~~TRINITY_DN12940_c0_g1_i2.p1  ORF type:complete len:200 (+),score=59.99 TRINITY_DN12940_c0_g1_i2:95-694(+)
MGGQLCKRLCDRADKSETGDAVDRAALLSKTSGSDAAGKKAAAAATSVASAVPAQQGKQAPQPAPKQLPHQPAPKYQPAPHQPAPKHAAAPAEQSKAAPQQISPQQLLAAAAEAQQTQQSGSAASSAASSIERRRDPTDGKLYSFNDLVAFYGNVYSFPEIEVYWQQRCQQATPEEVAAFEARRSSSYNRKARAKAATG